jgi:hypothetical protein
MLGGWGSGGTGAGCGLGVGGCGSGAGGTGIGPTARPGWRGAPTTAFPRRSLPIRCDTGRSLRLTGCGSLRLPPAHNSRLPLAEEQKPIGAVLKSSFATPGPGVADQQIWKLANGQRKA